MCCSFLILYNGASWAIRDGVRQTGGDREGRSRRGSSHCAVDPGPVASRNSGAFSRARRSMPGRTTDERSSSFSRISTASVDRAARFAPMPNTPQRSITNPSMLAPSTRSGPATLPTSRRASRSWSRTGRPTRPLDEIRPGDCSAISPFGCPFQNSPYGGRSPGNGHRERRDGRIEDGSCAGQPAMSDPTAPGAPAPSKRRTTAPGSRFPARRAARARDRQPRPR